MIMKKLLILLSVIAILFASCESDPSNLLPNVTGKSGEVVLVIDPDQWSSESGEEFRKKLTQQYLALPQKEPMFDLVNIPYDAFSSIFKTHRNIILAKVDKNIHEPKMAIQKNVWAKPQLVVNIVAQSDSALAAVIREKGDILIDRIVKKEMERYAANYKKYEQIGLADMIQAKFGVRLTMPKGYTLDLDTTDFMWIENRGRGDAVQGVLIYSYNQSSDELTTDLIFKKRNEFTKKFVLGPNKNSYMAVETEAIPYRREIIVNDLNIIELRNLWKVENDFMGGPFVNFTLKNEQTNKVIGIDAFVYAPQFDKRDYLRQLEAILNSVELPKNESTN